MKIKFFKKEKNFSKPKESKWLNINLYWEVAVIFMFMVFLASLAFGYYFFRQINKEFVSVESDESGGVQTVKKERIEKVLNYFSEREKKSNGIINAPAPVIDPSL